MRFTVSCEVRQDVASISIPFPRFLSFVVTAVYPPTCLRVQGKEMNTLPTLFQGVRHISLFHLHGIAVTLKMQDLKMTDKENYGSGKFKSGK